MVDALGDLVSIKINRTLLKESVGHSSDRCTASKYTLRRTTDLVPRNMDKGYLCLTDQLLSALFVVSYWYHPFSVMRRKGEGPSVGNKFCCAVIMIVYGTS